MAESEYDYCKIYARAPVGRDALAQLVGAALGSAPSALGSIDTADVTVDVRRNDDYDPSQPEDFGYWPYYLDITRNSGIDDRHMVSSIVVVLTTLWGNDVDAVAACSFEDELLAKGGYDRR